LLLLLHIIISINRSFLFSDYERIISTIEKGEAKLRKIQEIQEQLTAKVSQHRLPLQQLKISYSQSKGKNYTEDEDRFLVSITTIIFQFIQCSPL